MDEVWKTLIQAAPWGFIIIVMRYLEIKDRKEERVERSQNAAERNAADKAHDMEKNQLWSNLIREIFDRQEQAQRASADRIVTAVETLQKILSDQYEKMGITKDLYDELRREQRRKGG